MKFSATLDVNVVAHEARDEVACLIDLEAPALDTTVERAPATFQVVLDRSGSMAGCPLQTAIQALVDLVARLDARDSFGVVTFDDHAQVVVPCGPVVDKQKITDLVRSIHPGGMTDLGAGLLRGLQEVRRVGSSGSTLLLVSDGHTNSGITDADTLAGLADTARDHGVVTATLGLGLGYDEHLLAGISRAGSGNHRFADDPDAAGVAIAEEAGDLLAKSVQAASLTVRLADSVAMLKLFNDLPAHQVGDGTVMIELGDLYAGEQRKLLLELAVPAMASLGAAQVATMELRYVELPGLLEHTVSLPVSVNVVPGDEAAGRVPDPTVRTEVLFQEAQQDKRDASEALERGDRDSAVKSLRAARSKLDQAGRDAGELDALDVQADISEVDAVLCMMPTADAAYMSKRTRASFHERNRKRGRRDR